MLGHALGRHELLKAADLLQGRIHHKCNTALARTCLRSWHCASCRHHDMLQQRNAWH